MYKHTPSKATVPTGSLPRTGHSAGVLQPHIRIVCGESTQIIAWSRSDLFNEDYAAACVLLHAELVRNKTISSVTYNGIRRYDNPSEMKIFAKFTGDIEWMLLPPSQWKGIGQYAKELKVEHPGIINPYASWDRD